LPQSPPERPLTLTAAALWAVALWLVEHLCFEMTEALRPGAITDIVSVSACVVLATSAIVFAMIRIHAPEGSVREALGVRPVGPVRFALAIAAGVGLSPGLSTIDDLIAKRWPYDDPEAQASMDKLLGSTTHLALVVGVFVVIPLAREVFFRGILFTQLRAAGSEAASTFVTLVATSLLFTVFSLDWRSMPTALVLALSLGWLRARTGSVVAPVVAHLAFWSVQGIPILRGADPAADITYTTAIIAGGAALAAAALGLTGLVGRKSEAG
jgi:membrane protease YdiL (CAAX protease family)